MNLEQSEVLIDRTLVTLCAELPESLALYHTAKDQFTIGAIRAVPMLEHLAPESNKHFIVRDWMRTYVEHEDQPVTNEISFDSLRETMKKERKERAREAREKNGDLLSDDDEDKQQKKERSSKEKKNGKAKARAKEAENRKNKTKTTKQSQDTKGKRRQRPGDSESEEDISTSSGSSSAESSDSDTSDGNRKQRTKSSGKGKASSSGSSSGKGKQKTKSNLPPIEVVLSSDEDEELEELFDTEDPDVYEVETILDKRRARDFGESDLYLIKWVGYDDPTWEPADNVSKDLIEEYEGQPVRENEYVVEEIKDRKTVRDKQTNLKTFKYLVKWVGYDDETWEPAENLPHNLRRKFDTKFQAQKRRRVN